MKITVVDFYTVTREGDVKFKELESLGEVSYYGVLTPEELKTAAKDCTALLINKAEITEDLLSACPKIKYIGTFSTGFNNVDLAACNRRNITVCNVPEYSTNAVSQHVFALLLNYAGQIANYQKSVADGDWIKSSQFCYMPWATQEIYGKTFGVIGYGNIGKATAKIAQAFGMNVLVYSRSNHSDCPYKKVSLDKIFELSDYLSLHCALNEDTKKIVNEKTLSLMKNSAVLINTARGGLVDEDALATMLNTNKIAAALLDTLAVEPMLANNPLYGAKNCFITPHIAWAPSETRQRVVDIATQNLQAYLNGATQNKISK
ncbi:MAG: D-2-hydroxyacid dehydrogenase [Clostridia bacterium]|nr:D-2-hydroxyacid dehydrogenase [Clostridia bacterium]